MLRQNNKVCFEIEYSAEVIKRDVSCDWTSKYRSVVGYGSVEIVTDFDHKKLGLDIIMAHYGKNENNIYKDKLIDNIVILMLTIQEISGKQSGNWN